MTKKIVFALMFVCCMAFADVSLAETADVKEAEEITMDVNIYENTLLGNNGHIYLFSPGSDIANQIRGACGGNVDKCSLRATMIVEDTGNTENSDDVHPEFKIIKIIEAVKIKYMDWSNAG